MSLNALLPQPKREYEVLPSRNERAQAQATTSSGGGPPPYGQRQGFVPRTQADFGDGGAFPEILVAQYPRDMGRPGKVASTAIVPVAVDAQTGGSRFDSVVLAQHQDKIKVHSRFSDLVEGGSKLIQQRPSDDEAKAAAAKTAAALQSIVEGQVEKTNPLHISKNSLTRAEQSTQVIRYTPSEDTAGKTDAIQQRLIKMVEAPIDPLMPAKHKSKKAPSGPAEAPVPVMHSPPRKLTAAEQEDWKIPTFVSNWQNSRGYVIPLDKRMAADGRGLLEPTINDSFAKLSEALLIAERKARVEVETRAAIQKKLSMKEKEEKEQALRELAAKARMERAGVAPLPAASSSSSSSAAAAAATAPSHRPGGLLGEDYDEEEQDGEDDGQGQGQGADRGSMHPAAVAALNAAKRKGQVDELRDEYFGSSNSSAAPAAAADDGNDDQDGKATRDRLREERKRERERELRQEEQAVRGGVVKRPRKGDDEDRDVSEKIALGMPVGKGAINGGAEGIFDSRLFNQSEGISSGFGGEDDYAVYSKAWRSEAASNAIYKARDVNSRAGGGVLSNEDAEAEIRKLKGGIGGGDAGGDADFEGVKGGGGGANNNNNQYRNRGAGLSTGNGPVQFEKTAGITASSSSMTMGASSSSSSSSGASAAAVDPADPFGLDQFLMPSRDNGGKGKGNALDAIGRGSGAGFMTAAAGSASFSRGGGGGGGGRREMQFTEASGSGAGGGGRR